jgi:hypothetical protein
LILSAVVVLVFTNLPLAAVALFRLLLIADIPSIDLLASPYGEAFYCEYFATARHYYDAIN